MEKQKRPQPDAEFRETEAINRRSTVSDVSNAPAKPGLVAPANNEEIDHAGTYVTNFTKGLKHNKFGIVEDPADYHRFVDLLTSEWSDEVVEFDVTIGMDDPKQFRSWESPLAGQYYNVEGADSAAFAMAPAPKLGRSELCAEMAEVYAMAIMRDVPFAEIEDGTVLDASQCGVDLTWPKGYPKKKADAKVTVADIVGELNKLPWFNGHDHERQPVSSYGRELTALETRRREARWGNGPKDKLTVETLFRGSTPGARDKGPYLSQFMLVGNTGRQGKRGIKFEFGSSKHNPEDGLVVFGASTVDLRVSRNKKFKDFMVKWTEWLEVQQGSNKPVCKDVYEDGTGFIATGRDLATYVHFDQLYQAYFNACLTMLTNNVPFDPEFPNAPAKDCDNKNEPRGAFATFGGPHLLSLFPEVSSRALKAVRRQKFQVHRRARPEVLAARITMAGTNEAKHLGQMARQRLRNMLNELGADDPTDDSRPGALLHWVAQINQHRAELKLGDEVPGAEWIGTYDDGLRKNFLLPMAFPEGSPMHPAYGAGHATVAGACVTVLKAFFDSTLPMERAFTGKKDFCDGNIAVSEFLQSLPDGTALTSTGDPLTKATIAEELDKLAANIAIGRNMGGVHYYTDYYDSLRMGERVAVAMLEEQMLNYSEFVAMTFIGFDGHKIRIETIKDPDAAGKGWNNVRVSIDGDSSPQAYRAWLAREVSEFKTTHATQTPTV